MSPKSISFRVGELVSVKVDNSVMLAVVVVSGSSGSVAVTVENGRSLQVSTSNAELVGARLPPRPDGRFPGVVHLIKVYSIVAAIVLVLYFAVDRWGSPQSLEGFGFFVAALLGAMISAPVGIFLNRTVP